MLSILSTTKIMIFASFSDFITCLPVITSGSVVGLGSCVVWMVVLRVVVGIGIGSPSLAAQSSSKKQKSF